MMLKNSLLVILIITCFTVLHVAQSNSKQSTRILSQKSYKYSSQLLMKHHLLSYSKLGAEFKNEQINDNTEEENGSRKSSWLAFFLSLFLPTSGQIYNGDYTKAAIQGGLLLLGGGLVTTMACAECGESNPAQTTLLITGIGLAFSGYVWSILDAPISANNINARIRNRTGLAIYNSDDGRYSLRFYRVPIAKSYKISLAVNF